MGIALWAFFNLGSSGLSSTGTYLGTCFEVAFLLDEALLVERCTGRVLPGTCVGTCYVAACSLALDEVSLGEETASSTCWASYLEGPVGLEDFLVFCGRTTRKAT